MNTFTHILASINWVDVAMLVLLIRIIFIGVKTGFVTELFKLFGILCAVFMSLHYYASIAAFTMKKLKWSAEWLECAFFVLLVSLVVVAVKFMRDGFFTLFKFETTHAGVNQWGSGVLSILRAVFLASLIMFSFMLSGIDFLQKQTVTSISRKIFLNAAPQTYSYLFHNFIGKIFVGEKFNDEALQVASIAEVKRKTFK